MSKNGLYFRLTFDSDIRACISNDIFKNQYNWRTCIPGNDILEVKFDFTIPPWFHRIIQSYQLKRISVSKFVLGLEATNLAHDYEGIYKLIKYLGTSFFVICIPTEEHSFNISSFSIFNIILPILLSLNISSKTASASVSKKL